MSLPISLPKLILIILIFIAILALLGFWFKATFVKTEKEEKIPLEKSLEEGKIVLPSGEKEKLLERIFNPSLKKQIIQFLERLYDENQNGFKMTKDSSVGLEATYFGLHALRELETTITKKINSQAVIDMVRSYYVNPGYYLEEGKEPVFSTSKALVINWRFPEKLNQEIDLEWLKSNSLENKNLDSSKLSPEYQEAVVAIYRNLQMPKKLEEISLIYFDHYCDFLFPQDISDGEYLKEKYHQILLISRLSGANTISESCLREDIIEMDKEKLNQIQIDQLEDIKEIYWLYYLQKFYDLEFNLEKIHERIKYFYSEEGLKEKINDSEPNLIGTYYGILLIK